MSIARREVQHIAHLARIEFTPDEEQKFEKDLSAILGFVEKLNEVGTEDVEPMTGGTTLMNVMRKDEQIDKSLCGRPGELLNATPIQEKGFVKVKKIFE